MLIDAYQWQSVEILDKVPQSRDAVSLYITRPHGYDFVPGQHAIVRITTADGMQYVRQYSYSNAPGQDTIRFTITRSIDGIVSSWCIDEAEIGDTIEISQPFTGPLAIDIAQITRLGIIAGGSGIAPMMSHIMMLRDAKPHLQRTIIYSTRRNERCFRTELRARDNETIEVRLTDEQARFRPSEIRGLLHACDHILICGSRPFVTSMQALCRQYLPKAVLHCESFSL